MENSMFNSPKMERRINSIRHIFLKTIYRKRNAYWRAEYLKQHNVFHAIGDKCYYQSTAIPADVWLVSIGNNVKIAYGVEFITHDILGFMLNENERYKGKRHFGTHFAPIVIGNDVVVGGLQ